MKTSRILCVKKLLVLVCLMSMVGSTWSQVEGPHCAQLIYSDGSNGGDASWLNAPAARCDDNTSRAYVDLFVGENHSQFLHFGNFGLEVPDDARITGVEVVVIRKSDRPETISDRSVRLLVRGQPAGINQSQGDRWADVWTGAFFGGPHDAWGLQLTPAIVNHPDFGVAIDVSARGNGRAEIDELLVTVLYQDQAQRSVYTTARRAHNSCTPTLPAALGM